MPSARRYRESCGLRPRSAGIGRREKTGRRLLFGNDPDTLTDADGIFLTSRPSTVADPAVGRICPVIILIMVDLPEPLGPNRPKSAPFSTEKVTWLTAVRSPYTFVRPAVPITGAVMAGLPGEWRGNLRTMRKSGDGVPGDTGRYAGECSWGVHRHKGRCRVTGQYPEMCRKAGPLQCSWLPAPLVLSPPFCSCAGLPCIRVHRKAVPEECKSLPGEE